jgi:hypothetical protein
MLFVPLILGQAFRDPATVLASTGRVPVLRAGCISDLSL